MSNKPTNPILYPVLPLPLRRFERITIRQLSQLPAIDLASLDPVKRQAEEARRKALLAHLRLAMTDNNFAIPTRANTDMPDRPFVCLDQHPVFFCKFHGDLSFGQISRWPRR